MSVSFLTNKDSYIISLKCLTQSGTALYPSVPHRLQKWGKLYPTHLLVTPPMSGEPCVSSPSGFGAQPRPPKGFQLFSTLRMASSDTIILLSVYCHAAIGGKTPVPPPPLRTLPRSCIRHSFPFPLPRRARGRQWQRVRGRTPISPLASPWEV